MRVEEDDRVINHRRDLVEKGELVMAKMGWSWRRRFDDFFGDYFNF